MNIFKKQLRPGITLFVNSSGSSINFNLQILGTDPLRPNNPVNATVSPEQATLLLSTDWEAVPLPAETEKKG